MGVCKYRLNAEQLETYYIKANLKSLIDDNIIMNSPILHSIDYFRILRWVSVLFTLREIFL